MNGKLESFFPERGYGYIRIENGQTSSSVFFHASEVHCEKDYLQPNSSVEFDFDAGVHPQAKNIRRGTPVRTDSKIVKLLHDLTQLGIAVRFDDDFEGMLTVTYLAEDLDWRHHQHLGFPGCNLERLEGELVDSLGAFLEERKAREGQ